MSRPNWNYYFINIANVVATRSTCLRAKYGAVIVSSDNSIISTGYNGAPSGVLSCDEREKCLRDELGILSGTQYEKCYSIHAEMNAIIRSKSSVKDCTMYIGSTSHTMNKTPCFMCRRIIANAGILNCIYLDLMGDIITEDIKMMVMYDKRVE